MYQQHLSLRRRVMDRARTHQPLRGQGYGLLLALMNDDRPLRRILNGRWTIFRSGATALLAWSWGRRPTAMNVIDYNQRSDGDILIAFAH